jgi:hypothetical protein
MRPGLAVSVTLANDSSPGSKAYHGSVFKVGGKEAVVLFGTEKAAPALRLKPGSKVRICYRNLADGAVYFVPAEVKAKDGPRSLAFKLLGPPVVGEDRDQPRIEQLLRMEFEVVPAADVERVRLEILRGAQIVKYQTETPRHRAAVVGDEEIADALPPSLARHLHRIECKLDVLIERLGIDSRGVESEKPLYNVSLSSSGVRFRDIQGRCTPGDTVRLHIELPFDPVVEVIALGEVLRTVESATGEKLSTGRDVVIEFKALRDESRQAIERLCQQHDTTRRSA